jgi:hypothetical protein
MERFENRLFCRELRELLLAQEVISLAHNVDRRGILLDKLAAGGSDLFPLRR